MISRCVDCKNLLPSGRCEVSPPYRVLARAFFSSDLFLPGEQELIESFMQPCPSYEDSPEMRIVEVEAALDLSLRGWKTLLEVSRVNHDLQSLIRVCESALESQGEAIEFDPIPF